MLINNLIQQHGTSKQVDKDINTEMKKTIHTPESEAFNSQTLLTLLIAP